MAIKIDLTVYRIKLVKGPGSGPTGYSYSKLKSCMCADKKRLDFFKSTGRAKSNHSKNFACEVFTMIAKKAILDGKRRAFAVKYDLMLARLRFFW